MCGADLSTDFQNRIVGAEDGSKPIAAWDDVIVDDRRR